MVAPASHLKPYEWGLPVAVQFGLGSAERAAQSLQGRRVVVLVFAGAMMHEQSALFRHTLADALSDWVEVPHGLSTMTLCRSLAKRVWPSLARHPDTVLVGFGGGSVMDIAKWLRLRPDSGDDRELELLLSSTVQPPGWTRHELWLLPTTAGTGSEVTRWSTMWDTESKSAPKRSFDQAYAYADRAVVDPLLCLSCPHSVVLHSGLDAFGHCLEVLWNRHRNPVSVALAIDAARVIVRSLPLALSEPNDVTARVSLAQAALQAGMAFSQTRTALAHALSYALTIEQGVDHGAAVAVWLPVTWKMAAGHSEEVDAALQQIWNSPPITGPNRMLQWFAQIGFDTSLKSLGIDDVALRVQAALTHERGRNFEGRWMDGEG